MPANTPYNSLYESVQTPDSQNELICCEHGRPCNFAQTEDEKTGEDTHYDTVFPVKRKTPKSKKGERKKQEKMFMELGEKLKELELDSRRFSKFERKPTCESEDDSEVVKKATFRGERIINDDSSKEQESEGNPRYENMDACLNPREEPMRSDSDKSKKRKKEKKRKREARKREEKQRQREEGEKEVEFIQRDRRVYIPREKKEEKSKKGRYETVRKSSRSTSSTTRTVHFPNQKTSDSRIMKSVYIGLCSYSDAEAKVLKETDFRLYHQLPERQAVKELTQDIPLMLCYKTATGIYRHYPIRSRKMCDKLMFFVDYGNPKVNSHVSLAHLVKYYQMNVEVHPSNNAKADIFPWWNM